MPMIPVSTENPVLAKLSALRKSPQDNYRTYLERPLSNLRQALDEVVLHQSPGANSRLQINVKDIEGWAFVLSARLEHPRYSSSELLFELSQTHMAYIDLRFSTEINYRHPAPVSILLASGLSVSPAVDDDEPEPATRTVTLNLAKREHCEALEDFIAVMLSKADLGLA